MFFSLGYFSLECGINEAERLRENFKGFAINNISTKIVLQNDTDSDLYFIESRSYYGRWENEPPALVNISCIFH